MANLLQEVFDQLGYSGASRLILRGDDLPAGATDRVWTELRIKTGVDAAYFHGSTPLVAFASVDSPDTRRAIRRSLWNLSRVPVLIVTTDSGAAAYSCLVPPSEGVAEERAFLSAASDPTDLLSGLAQFTRTALEAGEPMSMYRGRFRRSERVDRHLLDNLRDLRRSLVEDPDRDHSNINALLGRSIFIRYFEDRGILTPDHCEELCGTRTFEAALEAGVAKTFELFSALSNRFNGDLFAVDPLEFERATDANLRRIAAFFRGTEVGSGQGSFFSYDFSIIPPELISAIYEQLLVDRQATDAAFYTPRPVVDLILDEVLPWEGEASPTRILDPACGSGIFLTEAFRRLLYRRYGSVPGNTSFADLADILTTSVFGIDINRDALRVAALGLYLALLEQLDPPDAWRDAHFPRLEDETLIEADFFDEHPLVGHQFDLVVGNPPWKSALTPAARNFVRSQRMILGDNQIAIAFVRRAEEFVGDEGLFGMLLPAKGLLHNRSNKTVAARLDLFSRWEVDTIIDLTYLRRDLFASAIAPSAVMIASSALRAEHPDGSDDAEHSDRGILHVVPRPSPLQRALDGFLVSTDDVNVIGSQLARTVPDIWKTYLRGSRRDLLLIQRLRATYPTLDQIAAEHQWIASQGLQIEGGNHYPSDHLVGLPIIPYDRVLQFHLAGVAGRLFEGQFDTVQAETMHRPRDEQLFRAPHLLVRRTVQRDRPAAVLLDFDAVFNNTIVGIAGPRHDEALLTLAEAYLNSSLARYYQLLTCSTWGVERSAIEENEILSMPFAHPEDGTVLSLARLFQADPEIIEARRSELDAAVFDAFDLSDAERDLVNDTLWQFDSPDRTLEAVDAGRVDRMGYTTALSETLRYVDETIEVEVGQVQALPHYLVVTVDLDAANPASSRPSAEQVSSSLSGSFDEAVSSGNSPIALVQPSLMVLHDRCAYLLKPNQQRYWTRSRAREDASQVLSAIVSATHGLTI